MRATSVAAMVAALVMVGPVQASASAPEDIASALGNRPLDGQENNLAHPDWGRAGRQYVRVAPAAYADGVGTPITGPAPRYVSNRVFADDSQNIFSENGVTQGGGVWGQFLDHTVGLREESGGQYAPLSFDAHDPLEGFRNDFGAIDFARTPAAP